MTLPTASIPRLTISRGIMTIPAAMRASLRRTRCPTTSPSRTGPAPRRMASRRSPGTHEATGMPAAPAASGGRRKVMLVMFGVIAVGVAAVAGTLTMRHRAGGHEVVTIQADTDPARVKPEQVENSATDKSQALFDRTDNAAGAKVVASAEQPADLDATVKSARVVGVAGVPDARPRPPPRRRRRMRLSRRRGRSRPFRFAPTAASSITRRRRRRAAAPCPAWPACRSPAWAPRRRERAGRPPPSRRTASPRRPLRPGRRSPSRSPRSLRSSPPSPSLKSPAAQASISCSSPARQSKPTPAPRPIRSAPRFSSALKGRHATFVEGKKGDATVYRVRVGHLSEDGAKQMCAAVKGQGGDCYVAN